MLGTAVPIRGAAVAHDAKKILAMLRRRPSEALRAMLGRLGAAITAAKATGSRVDEINDSSSDRRYELCPIPSRQDGLATTPTLRRGSALKGFLLVARHGPKTDVTGRKSTGGTYPGCRANAGMPRIGFGSIPVHSGDRRPFLHLRSLSAWTGPLSSSNPVFLRTVLLMPWGAHAICLDGVLFARYAGLPSGRCASPRAPGDAEGGFQIFCCEAV
jgi:hypothetical protein